MLTVYDRNTAAVEAGHEETVSQTEASYHRKEKRILETADAATRASEVSTRSLAHTTAAEYQTTPRQPIRFFFPTRNIFFPVSSCNHQARFSSIFYNTFVSSIGRDFTFIPLIPTPPPSQPSHSCHLISRRSTVRCNEQAMNFSSCRLLSTGKRCCTRSDIEISNFWRRRQDGE